MLEYEKEISFYEYLSDDSNNFLSEKTLKISDYLKDAKRNRRKMSIYIKLIIKK